MSDFLFAGKDLSVELVGESMWIIFYTVGSGKAISSGGVTSQRMFVWWNLLKRG